MVNALERARVGRHLRALFAKICEDKAHHRVFEQRDPLFSGLEGILVFRATRQNTTPVVVVLEEKKDKIFMHASYLTKPGTFNEKVNRVEATSANIASLEPLFIQALTFP